MQQTVVSSSTQPTTTALQSTHSRGARTETGTRRRPSMVRTRTAMSIVSLCLVGDF